MAPRYGSADTQERRLNVGRPRSTGTTGTTSSGTTPVYGKNPALDMYEGRLPWKELNANNPDYVAAEEYWNSLSPQQQAGQDKWYNISRFANSAAAGANAAMNERNRPPSSGGGAGGGNASMLDALRAMVQRSGRGNEADITSMYGSLTDAARQRAVDQQNMIDQFYGGAQSSAQARLNDTLSRLQSLIGGARTELDTQTTEGRQRIDDTTQRVLAALGNQRNPYEGVQALAAPVAQSPLMANLQALGQNTAGLSALQNMFAADAAQNRNATQDMINMLSASNRAAQQSRMGDVEFARAGSQQDLAAAQRAAAQMLTNQSIQGEQAARNAFDEQMMNLGQGALQARLSGSSQLGDLLNQYGLGQLQAVMSDRTNRQGREDELLSTLFNLGKSGMDVRSLIAMLGGG